MTDELKITTAITFANGGLKDKFDSEIFSITQSTQGFHGPVVTVGTAEEDLAIGDIATLGYALLRNLDAVNYVTYGPNSAGSMIAFGRIKAGEIAILRLNPGITFRWQANTAPVKVQVKLYND